MRKKNVTNKDILKEIEKLKNESRKQKGLGLLSILVAYILVGISMLDRNIQKTDFMGNSLIGIGIIGIIVVFFIDHYIWRKK